MSSVSRIHFLIFSESGILTLFYGAVGERPRPYDILWPTLNRRDPGAGVLVVETTRTARPHESTKDPVALARGLQGARLDSAGSLSEYARQLLRSFSAPSFPHLAQMNGLDNAAERTPKGLSVALPNGPPPLRMEDREEEGPMTGCREAVEILTRNLKKGELSWLRPSLKLIKCHSVL